MEVIEYKSDKLEEIKFIEITSSKGSKLKLMNLGATILEVCVPNREGLVENVLLTLDDERNYLTDAAYFGVTVGRTSGRIKNGEFEIDNVKYELTQNSKGCQLHGGAKGYSFKYFDYTIINNVHNVIVDYVYKSPDMEEGYPGNVNLVVRYTFSDNDVLLINYIANSDKKTIMNFTNHGYFNLSGNYKDNILGHNLTVNSDYYLEADDMQIPTGKKLEVLNTPFDFNEDKLIGKDISKLYSSQEKGYDHVWLFSDKNTLKLRCSESGRNLEVTTSYPAVVMYSHNYPTDNLLKGGKKQTSHLGLAIECQYEPNGINTENLNSAIYNEFDEYNHYIEYVFSVDK